ncbi:MAG: hypothetical protein ABI239_12705 [Aquihabitans sp.]
MSDTPRPRGPRRPPGRGDDAPATPRRPTPRPAPAAKKKATAKSAPRKASGSKATGGKAAAKPVASKAPAKKRPAAPVPKQDRPTGAKRPIPDAPGPRAAKAKARPKSSAAAKGPSSARLGSTAEVPAAKAASKATQTSRTTSTRAFDSGTVARIRSERSPRTGWESITGSTKAVVIEPEELLPALPTPATAFRQRYGVVYNTQGPRIRLGLLWLLAVAASLAFSPLRPYGLAVLYGVAAGLAAQQVVDAWHRERTGNLRWVTALGASSLPVLATAGTGPLGVGLLLVVIAAVVVAFTDRATTRELPVLAEAGNSVLAAGVCGGAAASLVLLANYDIGAVIILIVYLMVYDASDYIVGSGASNGVEGPLAGGLFIAGTTMLLAVTEVPPFRGADVWNFAILAAVACPAGQLLASAMLPRADAFAPALRRLDSLLIVAPAWAGLIGLYLQQVN